MEQSQYIQQRQVIEDYLKDYADVIMYFQAVLLGRLPLHFCVLLVVVNGVFYSISNTDVSVVAIICYSMVGLFIVSGAMTVLSFPWREHLKANIPVDTETRKLRPLSHISEYIAITDFRIRKQFQHFEDLRQINPARFYIYGVSFFSFLGRVTSYFSDLFLIYFLVSLLLLTPAIIENRLHETIYSMIKPYTDRVRAILVDKLSVVRNQLQTIMEPSPIKPRQQQQQQQQQQEDTMLLLQMFN